MFTPHGRDIPIQIQVVLEQTSQLVRRLVALLLPTLSVRRNLAMSSSRSARRRASHSLVRCKSQLFVTRNQEANKETYGDPGAAGANTQVRSKLLTPMPGSVNQSTA